jgi:uncharacterized membrane protein YraQ (UPF0718 family)
LKVSQAFLKTFDSLNQRLPILIGMLLLVSLSMKAVPAGFYSKIFTGNNLIDPLVGAALGSLSAGNAMNSYIIGGEFLAQGVSLLAVTAFIIAWVSVGIIQLPAESMILGRKFAIARNVFSFLTALIISVLTFATLSLWV